MQQKYSSSRGLVCVTLVGVGVLLWGCAQTDLNLKRKQPLPAQTNFLNSKQQLNATPMFNAPSTVLEQTNPVLQAPPQLAAPPKIEKKKKGKRASLSQEEQACLASGQVRPGPYLQLGKAIQGRHSACRTRQGFVMSATADGAVTFAPAATLRCTMVPEVRRWVRETVQPAARHYFGTELRKVRVAASYGCRTRNNRRGAKLSEHGRANALDVSAFELADGHVVVLKKGWRRGTAAERGFLRAVHKGACKRFTTVLGPNADKYHQDHFHMDLARHGRTGWYRLCK